MRGRLVRKKDLFVAAAGALIFVLLAVASSATAGDLNVDQAATAAAGDNAPTSKADEQRDAALVAFDSGVGRYFGADVAETFLAPYPSLAFDAGRRPWLPLVRLTSAAGLSVDLGAGRINPLAGAGDLALDHCGLGLGAAYQGEVLSWYLLGLKNVRGLDSPAGGYGDLTEYRISAGGAMNSIPVAVGLDLYYLDRGDQARGGDVGFGPGPGVAGEMNLSVEEILFSGFLDGESSLYRRPSGGAKLAAASLPSDSQGTSPAAIRGIGGHLQFRPLVDTAFQLGGAYLQFVEDVTSSGGSARDESLGTSMYLRLTHGFTDSLQLKAAFDYLFPSDATRQARGDEDAYKVAAGLFWSW
jgi:hypothetical protein